MTDGNPPIERKLVGPRVAAVLAKLEQLSRPPASAVGQDTMGGDQAQVGTDHNGIALPDALRLRTEFGKAIVKAKCTDGTGVVIVTPSSAFPLTADHFSAAGFTRVSVFNGVAEVSLSPENLLLLVGYREKEVDPPLPLAATRVFDQQQEGGNRARDELLRTLDRDRSGPGGGGRY